MWHNLILQQATVNAQMSMSLKSGSIEIWFSIILLACGPTVIPQNITGIQLILQPLLQPRHWWSLLLQSQMPTFQKLLGPKQCWGLYPSASLAEISRPLQKFLGVEEWLVGRQILVQMDSPRLKMGADKSLVSCKFAFNHLIDLCNLCWPVAGCSPLMNTEINHTSFCSLLAVIHLGRFLSYCCSW